MRTQGEDTAQRIQEPARSDRVFVVPIRIGLAYIAASTVLPKVVVIDFGFISLHLIVASVLGWIGWRSLRMHAELRRYLPLAGLFGVWTIISSISAWDARAIEWSLGTLLWLVFIIPGIANLIREDGHRKALLAGFLLASIGVALVVVARLTSGASVFDPGHEDARLVLGMKPGFVETQSLFTLPLAAWYLARSTLSKLLAAAILVLPIVFSEGRSGLVGLAIIGMTLIVVQPGTGRKVRVAILSILIGLTGFYAISESGGQAAVGLTKLTEYIDGDSGSVEEVRDLQLRRAWSLGIEHPLFGVGYDGIQGQEVPVLGEASSAEVRRIAGEGGVHNTYSQVFGELGIPAFLLLMVLLGSLLVAVVRLRKHHEAQALIAGGSAALMMLWFHPLSLEVLYYLFVYALGVVGRYSIDHPSRQWGGDRRMAGIEDRGTRS